MTAIDPAGRYGSMKEMLGYLERVNLSAPKPRSRRPVRQARPHASAPVASKPVFVDDGRHAAEPQPRRRVKVKKGGVTTGAVGFVLFLVFLVILFFISSFVTKLMLEQFSNRPIPERLNELMEERGKAGWKRYSAGMGELVNGISI
jgi:hypothetical protein